MPQNPIINKIDSRLEALAAQYKTEHALTVNILREARVQLVTPTLTPVENSAEIRAWKGEIWRKDGEGCLRKIYGEINEVTYHLGRLIVVADKRIYFGPFYLANVHD